MDVQTFISSRDFNSSTCGWEMKLSPFMGVNTSFASSLQAWIPDAFMCSNSSMSATRMFHFQILSAYNRRILLARLLNQTDVVSICLSQRLGDIRPLRQTGRVLYMVFQNVSHMVSSHQTRDLQCFEESSNIPWEQPTIFSSRPDDNSTADVPSFTLRTFFPRTENEIRVDLQTDRQLKSQGLSRKSRQGARLERVHVHPCCTLTPGWPKNQTQEATRVRRKKQMSPISLHEGFRVGTHCTDWCATVLGRELRERVSGQIPQPKVEHSVVVGGLRVVLLNYGEDVEGTVVLQSYFHFLRVLDFRCIC